MTSEFDVVVVGSGAGGALVAYKAALSGLRVAVLEAGRQYDAKTESTVPALSLPERAPLRGAVTPDRPVGYFAAFIGGYSLPGEPYVTSGDESFRWFRARMLGGRTNHWGRVSFRCGPYDLQPSLRGLSGFDWPVTYCELAPYYDEVESYVGVSGETSLDALEHAQREKHNAPVGPDLIEGAKLRAFELAVKRALEPAGYDVLQAPIAIITRPPKTSDPSRKGDTRQACVWATPCDRGCPWGAAFQTTTSLIPWALATGNVSVFSDTVAIQVEFDEVSNRVRGVRAVNRLDGTRRAFTGRAVVLAASSFESVKILLNSACPRFPTGLGNSSGRLGKGIMDTRTVELWGYVPSWRDAPSHDEYGAWRTHSYIPWWGFKKWKPDDERNRHPFHVAFYGGRQAPTPSRLERAMAILHAEARNAVAAELRSQLKSVYGAILGFAGRGEVLPTDRCYCELDRDGSTDQWGMPSLRFHWKWGPLQSQQAEMMQGTFEEFFRLVGGKPITTDGNVKFLNKKPGELMHEVGGASMGRDPTSSVTNNIGRVWDAPNLFLADGSVFPTSPHKNPTLTIMALAARMTDNLTKELKTQGDR